MFSKSKSKRFVCSDSRHLHGAPSHYSSHSCSVQQKHNSSMSLSSLHKHQPQSVERILGVVQPNSECQKKNQSELLGLQKRLKDSEEECAQLKAVLLKLNDVHAEKLLTIDDLSKQVLDLTLQLNEVTEKCALIEEHTRCQVQLLTASNDDLLKLCNKAKSREATLLVQVSHLQAELGQYLQFEQSVNASLASITTKYQDLESNYSDLKQNCELVSEMLQKEKGARITEKAASQRDYEELLTGYMKKKGECTLLFQQLDQLEMGAVEDIKLAGQRVESCESQLLSEVAGLKLQVTTLQELEQSTNTSLDRISTKYQDLEANYADLKRSWEDLDRLLQQERRVRMEERENSRRDYDELLTGYMKKKGECTLLYQQLDQLERGAVEEAVIDCKMSSTRNLLEEADSCSQSISIKASHEDLITQVALLQAQLKSCEEEKRVLMEDSSSSKAELRLIFEKYTEILGHQNRKQKIRHVIGMKERNIKLQEEVKFLKQQVARRALQETRALDNRERVPLGVLPSNIL